MDNLSIKNKHKWILLAIVGSLYLKSVSAQTTNWLEQPLRDFKGPIPIQSSNPWPWIIGTGTVIVAIGLIMWLLKRPNINSNYVSNHMSGKSKDLPIQLIALRMLEQAPRYVDDPKQFCIVLSRTIRFYLEQELNLPTTTATTGELIDQISSKEILPNEQVQLVNKILTKCDLAKFAAYSIPPEHLLEMYRETAQFIQNTHWLVKTSSSIKKSVKTH